MTNEEAIALLSNYFNWCQDCIDHNHSNNRDIGCDECMCKATELAIKSLEKQSTIVHCVDCRYSHMTISGDCKYCDIHSPYDAVYFPSDYFCAGGEKESRL